MLGHQRIGKNHTASMLANVLGRIGHAGEALAIIEHEIARAPKELELLAVRIGLLEATGKLDDAESAASALIQKAPRQMGLYRQLARIRERRGERAAAAQVLEWGLDTCCGSPGKCGNQPLDVQAVRALARLYLEDRIAPERTSELLQQLGKHVQQPSWDDGYLAALSARNNLDPRASDMARRLIEGLPSADPRRIVVVKAFDALSRRQIPKRPAASGAVGRGKAVWPLAGQRLQTAPGPRVALDQVRNIRTVKHQIQANLHKQVAVRMRRQRRTRH
jgi:hypothetical protein